MSSGLWLIWVGLSSLIFILVWVSYKWGKTSHKKETLNESVKIKDKQLRVRKPTVSNLIERMRRGGL